MNNTIYKISNIVNNVINEAFDFDNEINVESTISDEDMAYLNAVPNRNAMDNLDICDLFLGLYKARPPFKKKNLAHKTVDNVGPIWYYTDILNIDSFFARNTYIPYDQDNEYIALTHFARNIMNFHDIEKLGYKLYRIGKKVADASYRFYNISTSLAECSPIILQLLSNLAKLIGVEVLVSDWKDPKKYENKICGAFAISPDNGIMIVHYLINISDNNYTESNYTYIGTIKAEPEIYVNIKHKCILYSILYTGLVKYEISSNNINDIKQNITLNNREETFKHLLLQSCGINNSAQDESKNNTHGYKTSFIQTANGDFVMPLGSTKLIRTYWAKDATRIYNPAILTKYHIIDRFPTNNKKENEANPSWMNYCVIGQCQEIAKWKTIFFDPTKFVIFQRFPYAKFIISLEPKYIGQLCGKEIEEECSKRPILLEKRTFDITKTDSMHIVYACIWFDDEFIDEFKDFLDKKYTIQTYRQKLIHKTLTHYSNQNKNNEDIN